MDVKQEESTSEEPDFIIIVENEENEQNIIEHICAKCRRAFKNMSSLNRHLAQCRKKTAADLEKPPTTMSAQKHLFRTPSPEILNKSNTKTINSLIKKRNEYKIAPIAETCTASDGPVCFCCNEPVESAHMGHISCKFCVKMFKSHTSRIQHVELLHSSCTDFKCDQCSAQCPSQDVLDQHVASHKSGKPFSCSKCGKDFTRKYHLERHGLTSNCGTKDKEPDKELVCNVCSKAFSRLDNLREHLRGHMGQRSRKRDFPCPMCDKSFLGLSLLNIHVRTHTGERPFPCDLCDKSFPSNGALRKHRRVHTGERPYQCSVCESRFTAKEVLNRHMKIHTGEKNYKCQVCGDKFIQASQLRNHMFHHTGKSEWKCDHCGEHFERKTRLVKHMDTEHAQAKKCDQCTAMFLTKEELDKHKERHEEGVFLCEECDISFPDKPALNEHLAVCADQQTQQVQLTFNCEQCNRKFKRMDLLNRHERAHSYDLVKEPKTKKAKLTPVKNKSPAKNKSPTDKKSPKEKIPEKQKLSIRQKNAVFNKLKNDLGTKSANLGLYPSDMAFKYNDKMLVTSLVRLLKVFFDEKTLASFGWPNASVNQVLVDVIENLDLQPHCEEPDDDIGTKLRENTKILFSALLDPETFEAHVNNYTMDEMIQNVICEFSV